MIIELILIQNSNKFINLRFLVSDELAEIEEAVRSLQELGWSDYEAKTYSALVSLGPSKASDISRVSTVPSNRVYQILNKLSDNGYVEKISTSRTSETATYKPKSPKDLINDIKNKKINQYDYALNALETLQERINEKSEIVAFTIAGRKELNAHFKKVANSTKAELLIAVDTLVELKYMKFKDFEFGKDVTVQVMTNARGVDNDYEKEIGKSLIEDEIPLRVSEDEFGSILVISDNKQIIFVNYAIEQTPEERKQSMGRDGSETLFKRNYIGYYLGSGGVVDLYRKVYNLAWDSAREENFD